ncbi:zinc ABC transporter substrate-binding protein [Gordonia polyisoprenivorans]|uniref:metal ABC transporter solute-binding protein, Zn/Mn family n=1 Tax=Gordonia polyisoprenivorans TaxID=84595 RepID=UPI001B8D64AA|nr:zinc ABC transporter substrate-binding protein [Gordonia polyisoprenivorans]QUD81825.1 zinc ABC transporter substrate-binding protein [Gordonia polyisoprenivorans]
MKRALVASAGLLTAAALVLSGCSDDGGGSSSGGKPTVVTSTNVWGSVASAVAGNDAEVTALFTNSADDPHEFEPSASDTAKVADASVILMNGGHYDEYMEQAAKNSSGTVINAFDIMEGGHEESTEETGTDEGHSHEVNEHVFYNLAVVGTVATKLGEALAAKDSAHAETYRTNALRFNTELAAVRNQVSQIKAAHNGTKVAQTEPLAGYLLTEAGLSDVSPAGFTAAVEEGQSPSAADRAALQDLLTSRTVKAFIYNTQAVDTVTEALLTVAQGAKVPVVKFTETLPDGVSDYVVWQRGQVEALAHALNSSGA